MRRLHRGALLSALLALTSCTQEAGLHVVVEGDLVPGQQFELLALRVTRAGEAVPCLTDSVPASHAFPYAFNLVSGRETPPGTVLTLTARAIRGTQVLAETTVEETLTAGQMREIKLTLAAPAAIPVNGSCFVDLQCGASRYCRSSDSTCQERLPLAASCSSGSQCTSGFCADGVCCNAACDGSCDVCNTFGNVGTCSVLTASAMGAPSCSPAYCSGTSGSCASGCANDFECVATGFCSGGSCQSKRANGQSCSRAAECGSGFCADGVCCNSACGGACDVCNATPGTCTFAARGSAGSPSCGLYACTGSSASCATTCGGSQTCAAGITCNGATCTPKANALRDDFQDNSRDGAKWSAFSQGSGASAAERNGKVEVTLTSSQVYAGFESVGRYDLSGSSASVLIATTGDQARQSCGQYLTLSEDDSHFLAISIRDNRVRAEVLNGSGGYSEVDTTAYPASGKYLRLRETGGTVYWEVSSNNSSWTTFATRSVASLNFGLTQMKLEINSGCFISESGLGTWSASFEAVNP